MRNASLVAVVVAAMALGLSSTSFAGHASTKVTGIAKVNIMLGNQTGFSIVVFKAATLPAGVTGNGVATATAITTAGGTTINNMSQFSFTGINPNTTTSFIVAVTDAIAAGPDFLVGTADDNTIVVGTNAKLLTVNSGPAGATKIIITNGVDLFFARNFQALPREMAYASVGLMGLFGLWSLSRRLGRKEEVA